MKEASTSNSKATSTSPSNSNMDPKESPVHSTSDAKDQPPPSPRESSLTPPPPSAPDDDVQDSNTKSKVELVKVIDNSAIVCPHGFANPDKAEQMKRVSQVRLPRFLTSALIRSAQLTTTSDIVDS
jgi:hypothetical protein